MSQVGENITVPLNERQSLIQSRINSTNQEIDYLNHRIDFYRRFGDYTEIPSLRLEIERLRTNIRLLFNQYNDNPQNRTPLSESDGESQAPEFNEITSHPLIIRRKVLNYRFKDPPPNPYSSYKKKRRFGNSKTHQKKNKRSLRRLKNDLNKLKKI